MTKPATYYLDLVGFSTPEQAYRRIRDWVSHLSDDEHFIRSTIFDIHAGIELLLRQALYHHLKALLFLTSDEQENTQVLKPFDLMIERLNFGAMYRLLRPILNSWPYPEMAYIEDLNNLRNQAAHYTSVEGIRYKNRNPFRDADAFAQVYFDAWAIKTSFARFFSIAIEGPRLDARRYYEQAERCRLEHGGVDSVQGVSTRGKGAPPVNDSTKLGTPDERVTPPD